MRKIRESSEEEMIAMFLQTELASSRFHQAIGELMQQEGIDPHVVEATDWSHAHENALRRALLGVYRGYGRNADYFQGFPTSVRWERVNSYCTYLQSSGGQHKGWPYTPLPRPHVGAAFMLPAAASCDTASERGLSSWIMTTIYHIMEQSWLFCEPGEASESGMLRVSLQKLIEGSSALLEGGRFGSQVVNLFC